MNIFVKNAILDVNRATEINVMNVNHNSFWIMMDHANWIVYKDSMNKGGKWNVGLASKDAQFVENHLITVKHAMNHFSYS